MSGFSSPFYDLNTHPNLKDEASAYGLAMTARQYGYRGIGANTGAYSGELNVPDVAALEIYRSIELSVPASKLRQEIDKNRSRADVLIVRGGDENINRDAVENPHVDILSNASEFNHVMAKEAAANMVALEFDIGAIIRYRGGFRVKILTLYRENLKLARKYGFPIVITSNASSLYDLRTPRDIAALSMLFGMELHEAVAALSTTPEYIIQHKKFRHEVEVLGDDD